MIRYLYCGVVLLATAALPTQSLQKDEEPPFYLDFQYPSQPSPENESAGDAPSGKSDNTKAPYSNFWEWKKACLSKNERNPVSSDLFISELSNFIHHFKKSTIIDHHYWVQATDSDTSMPSLRFLLTNSFEPYVTKLEVEPDEKTLFMGDIHGDIDSFNQFLEALSVQKITDPQDPFKIIDPKTYIIFLGDYTDRGQWGIEVLYALLRFMRENSPTGGTQKVFGLRGNHEDILINSVLPGNNLYTELRKKFGKTDILYTLESVYNCLPLALFLKSGKHALLACHGAIDPGFADTQTLLASAGKLRYILINSLKRKQLLSKLPHELHPAFEYLEEQGEFQDIDGLRMAGGRLIQFGFLWNDYEFTTGMPRATPIEYVKGRGMRLTEHITKAWFELNSSDTCRIFGNIRGHQHSEDTMPRILNQDGKSEPQEAGLAKIWVPAGQKQPLHKLWPGIVCTLCVCPHNGYGESYDFKSGVFCTLTTGKTIDDWNLVVTRLENTP